MQQFPNNSFKPHQKFLLVFFICTSCSLLFVGVFNYLIDPFDYFKVPSTLIQNEKKLPGNIQERFTRAMRIMSNKPQAIMLGSSRVRAGFAESHYQKLVGYPAYKAAFSGARFDEIFSYFEHALLNQPDLKAAFIGIDFFSFSENLTPIAEYSEDRMRRSSATIHDWFKLLLSKDTLKFSYETYNHNKDPTKMEIESRTHVKVDDHDYLDLSVSMIDSPQDFLKAEKRVNFDHYVLDTKKVEMFRKIVETCKEKNIDLKIVVSPAHALYWETIFQSGRWDDFENWKRELSAIYPIYDFSGFSIFNAEALSKDKSGLYLYELSHYTPFYGKMILDKIYGVEDRCPDTGFLLTKNTVNEHLRTLKKQREAWIKQNPDQIDWLRKELDIDAQLPKKQL